MRSRGTKHQIYLTFVKFRKGYGGPANRLDLKAHKPPMFMVRQERNRSALPFKLLIAMISVKASAPPLVPDAAQRSENLAPRYTLPP